MLRLLCIVACFLFVTNVTAAEKYIRVTGEGNNVEQAKENAFRNAIQIRAGAIVLSEREAISYTLTKDNVSVFSAGYIDDFKIIDITQTEYNIKLTLDVLVADSKLLNQVLNTGKTNQTINGERAGVARRTYLNQKQRGDNLLGTVLNTYPQNAFIIEQKPYTLSVDSYRNAVLSIQYKLSWNYAFIVAMNESMSLLEDKLGFFQHAPSNVIIMAKNPKDFVFGNKNIYKFNDRILLDNIKDSISGNREIRILLSIHDISGNMLYRNCYIPLALTGRNSAFYGIGEPKLFTIFGNQTETAILEATIEPKNNYVIANASTIQLSVVPQSSCN